MRRRGRTNYCSINYGAAHQDCFPTGPEPSSHKDEGPDVPQVWRDNAHQPWKILFPDLEWTPPPRDE